MWLRLEGKRIIVFEFMFHVFDMPQKYKFAVHLVIAEKVARE
jgi:hypothetical protein